MVRNTYIDFALGEATRWFPQSTHLIIESCSHHAMSSLDYKDKSAPAENKRTCARFTAALVSYIRRNWPRFDVSVKCFPEAESVGRMLGSRLLIMTIPSSFSFVSGALKGREMITPKWLGREPAWDDTDLHKHVPWTMFPGQGGTDVLAVNAVPNYYQFDYNRFLRTNQVASIDERPWVSIVPDPQRNAMFYGVAGVLAVLLGLLCAFSAIGARRHWFERGQD